MTATDQAPALLGHHVAVVDIAVVVEMEQSGMATGQTLRQAGLVPAECRVPALADR